MTAQPHRFGWVLIAAALTTLGLKFAAWYVTDSVGLLSDALESLVNLAGVARIIRFTRFPLVGQDGVDRRQGDHQQNETHNDVFTS